MSKKTELSTIAAILAAGVCANAEGDDAHPGIKIDEDLDDAEGWPKAKMVSKCHKLFHKMLVRDFENEELYPSPKDEGTTGVAGLADLLKLLPTGPVADILKSVLTSSTTKGL